MALGDSDTLKVGQMAVAFGSPFGQAFTMTTGIVSALERTIRSGTSPFSTPEVIQTDAPINPGNSGGPLLDRRGRVIGVNTQIISRSGASAGVGFAVPVNTAIRVIPELIENGKYDYAYLGISGATLRPSAAEELGLPAGTQGVLLVNAVQGGPADLAGLRGGASRRAGQSPPPGDVIVGIDGLALASMEELVSYMAESNRPGDRITLDVVRVDGERDTVEVVLSARPERPANVTPRG